LGQLELILKCCSPQRTLVEIEGFPTAEWTTRPDPEGQVSPARGEITGKDCELFWSTRVYEIPNSKHHITNKSQIPISNDQNKF
jgi:hypothetical protein